MKNLISPRPFTDLERGVIAFQYALNGADNVAMTEAGVKAIADGTSPLMVGYVHDGPFTVCSIYEVDPIRGHVVSAIFGASKRHPNDPEDEVSGQLVALGRAISV